MLLDGIMVSMDIAIIVFEIVVLLFSAILHEIAHGYMAERLGDDTARRAGRLTLNPLVHLDPFGSILMPILLIWASGGSFFFAAAKPVPYNPNNLRDPRSVAPQLSGFTAVLSDDHTLEIEMSKTQSLNDIFAQLSAQGIAVNSMRNKVNRLEELFIRLVDGSAKTAAAKVS